MPPLYQTLVGPGATTVSLGLTTFSALMILQYLPEVGLTNYQNVKEPLDTYDFVIVGGGTAGCTLAARLSEVSSFRVLLLESGGNPPPAATVPTLYPHLWSGPTNYNWTTVPQRHASFAYENNITPFRAGRGLGGSSGFNQMVFVRGNRRDFDNWASMGNSGWDYDSVLPYFKKLETYHPSDGEPRDPNRGGDGPIQVERKSWASPLTQGLLKAGKELGYKTLNANAGDTQIGFSIPEISAYKGTRSSSVAYLDLALKRPNLHVVVNAHVTKILFDNNGRATGVSYTTRNGVKKVWASREVIVSCGTAGSAHLLLLSGVGPARELRRHRIPVVANIHGVGQNLMEHPAIFGLSWTLKPGLSYTSDHLEDSRAIQEYVKYRKGPYSVPADLEINAWPLAEKGDPEWPEFQSILTSTTPAYSATFDGTGFSEKFYEDYYGPIKGKEGFSNTLYITRPFSRGSVTLNSGDPRDAPKIDPNYLHRKEDVDILVRAIKFAVRLGETSTLKNEFGAKFHDKPVPGCDSLPYGSYDYWACVARSLVRSPGHPVGTCKMAPSWDRYGVVDHRLRVRGVKSLRVIDASIMPVITSANLNAVVYMIAEKGADMIKEDHWVPAKSKI
ncbi:glucose dehydrogenase [FAD, quinone]-like [Oratosquilla oratoria]|uniref:glucose dehydrogenase [FAD, quinone]-like n=1 Tax=Oratosquilla oratoria TaxID=337810 RepID=UPI003F76FB4D